MALETKAVFVPVCKKFFVFFFLAVKLEALSATQRTAISFEANYSLLITICCTEIWFPFKLDSSGSLF